MLTPLPDRAYNGGMTTRPAYMTEVEAKAEEYAARWGIPAGEVKLALHDVFSLLAVHDTGPYAAAHVAGAPR